MVLPETGITKEGILDKKLRESPDLA